MSFLAPTRNQLIAVGLTTTTLTVLGGGPFALGASTGVTTAATTASLVQLFLIVTALITSAPSLNSGRNARPILGKLNPARTRRTPAAANITLR